jgi:3D (Asp-Asp-Asp) domain-containing protein
MGKRLILTIAVLIPLSSSLLSAPATNQSEDNREFGAGALIAYAKEAEKTSFVHIIEDSIKEKPALLTKANRQIFAKPQELDVWVTAYSSHPSETDDTPFITASGTVVRDGVAASNIFPIGTKFRLPDYFGDKVFVVEDRMNPRYNDTHIVDIWFSDRSEALNFGKRTLTLELL